MVDKSKEDRRIAYDLFIKGLRQRMSIRKIIRKLKIRRIFR